MDCIATVSSFSEIEVGASAAILCDLDGCLVSGHHLYEGASEFVRACGERLWIVSNNSSDTAFSLSARLERLGLVIAPRRIVLAGEETIRRLMHERPGGALGIYADPPLRLLAQQLGRSHDPVAPDVVVLGRDGRFGLKTIQEIAGHVVDGAELWATNLDLTHPAASGHPVPETGALIAAILACTGPVRVRSLGKPAPDLIEIALGRSGVKAAKALFVGDNAATDGEAACAAGVPFIRIAHPARGATPVAVDGQGSRRIGI